MTTRVAAIDCGTNSIRLLVADVDPRTGALKDLDRRMRIVRLGQGVDRTGRLAPEALERHYVEVFDLRRKSSLHLTYYLHGDTRRRGMALLTLAHRYKAAGWEIDVITVTKPETGTMRLASIEYRVDVTRPGKRGGPPTRTQALNIDITVDTTDVGTIGRPKVAVDAEWTFHARADDELRALVEGVDMTGAESAIQKALEKGKLWDDVQFTGGSSGGK